MGNLLKTVEAIAKKMSFSDYEKPKDLQSQVETDRRHQKKVKLTLYLTEEEEQIFNDIYIKRMQSGNKTDRSTLFSESIKLLHAQELAKTHS